MAINEVCRVWLEQELEEGLKQGKTAYALGKEISKEIEEIFGVEIKPMTIEKQAQRANAAIKTNALTAATKDPSRELCVECNKRVIRINKKKLPEADGLCRACYDLKNKKAKDPEQINQPPEMNIDHQEVWETINDELVSLINYIMETARFPVFIAEELKTELSENFVRLSNLFETIRERK